MVQFAVFPQIYRIADMTPGAYTCYKFEAYIIVGASNVYMFMKFYYRWIGSIYVYFIISFPTRSCMYCNMIA